EHAVRQPVVFGSALRRDGVRQVPPLCDRSRNQCDSGGVIVGYRVQSPPGNLLCCSWSGGKDSCLALHRMLAQGGQLACLVTMFTEDGQRSRSHGLARKVLEAQAAAIDVPLLSASATWEEYETAFIELLRAAKDCGATTAV